MKLKWNMMILCVILCMSVAVSACGKKKNQSQEKPDLPQKETVMENESGDDGDSDKDELDNSEVNDSEVDNSGGTESDDFGDLFNDSPGSTTSNNQSGGSSDNKEPPVDGGDSETPDNSNTDNGNSQGGLTESQDPNGNIPFGPIY